MQTAKVFVIECNTHKGKKVGFICTKSGCSKRLICPICVKDHDKTHEKFLISIVEMCTYDYDSDLEAAQKITSEASEEIIRAQSELDVYLDTLKIHLNQAIEEIRSEIKLKEDGMNTNDLFASLKEEKEKLGKFTDLQNDELISKMNEFCESFTKFREIQEKLANRKPCASFTYDTTTYQKTKEAVFKLLKKTTRTQYVSKPWNWSTEKRSQELILDVESGRVERPKGSRGNHGILGDIVFTEGVHKWVIDTDKEIDSNHWGVGFGIIKKRIADNVRDWKTFPYDDGHCRASLGNTSKMRSIEKTDHRGKKSQCILDFNSKTFEVLLDGKVVAKTDIDADTEYVPFLDFNSDAYAILSFEEL